MTCRRFANLDVKDEEMFKSIIRAHQAREFRRRRRENTAAKKEKKVAKKPAENKIQGMKNAARTAVALALATTCATAAPLRFEASETVATEPVCPQSSVEDSSKTVDKTVDWTVDKTMDGSTNERILNLLATNPRATQEELARVLGLSVRGIEYAIGTLKKAKRVRKVDGKRFGHWVVIG